MGTTRKEQMLWRKIWGNYNNRSDALEEDLTVRMSTVENDVTFLKTGQVFKHF